MGGMTGKHLIGEFDDERSIVVDDRGLGRDR
jgi:hypothetical protein